MRTYSGRPRSSMRFSTSAAMDTSVACRPSVRDRRPSPMTRFQRATSDSTRARQLYPDAFCQPMRPRSAMHRRGTVKLLVRGRADWQAEGNEGNMLDQSSGRGSNPADVGPRPECSRPCGSILAGGDMVAAEMKEVVDLIVGGEEPLRLPRRLEALHLPFSSARRL